MSVPASPAIGTLRDRVTLQHRTMADEIEGGHSLAFATALGLWARVRALSGRQTSLGDARASAITHTVVVRYRTDIAPGDRFVFMGRDLDVISAADLNGARAFLSCACAETSVTG